jgi:DNA gyrase/topoisomerase IV subunit A
MTLITSDQMGIQFKLDEINSVGKTAKGVKGIALNEGATIIQVNVGTESKKLPVQHRAGKGTRLS